MIFEFDCGEINTPDTVVSAPLFLRGCDKTSYDAKDRMASNKGWDDFGWNGNKTRRVFTSLVLNCFYFALSTYNVMYQSRKRKYTSRKEKYNVISRFVRILGIFSFLGLCVWLFFRRQSILDWANTFFF